MADCVEKDLPEALSVLKEIKKSSGECLQGIRTLIASIKAGPSTKQGLSFLEVKNHLLASYMANLGLLMEKKTSGHSLAADPAVDRLVEIRTVLEKMRPIEHKLRYQINKLVTAYKEEKLDPSDPRKFKANFSAFSTNADHNSSDEEPERAADSAAKSQLYVAPKLAPVHYSDDETTEERQKKLEDKQSKRALSSAMLREMREQYTDAPTEITESRDLHRIRENKRSRERTQFEEDNFMRLSVSRKESAGMRKLGTMSALGTLADFDTWDGDPDAQGGASSKKKKMKLSGQKKKGKSFGKKGGKRTRR